MRSRIEKEKGTKDIWDLKQVRGGLVDLEFVAQHLQLVHAAARPEFLTKTRWRPCRNLQAAGLLPGQAAEALLPAAWLVNNLTQVLRLCLDGPFEPAKAPEGLKTLLAGAGQAP
jgi:glutamate-ammonia-ligase adenylyltransferase